MRSFPWKQMLLSSGTLLVIAWQVPLTELHAAFQHLDLGSLGMAIFSMAVLLFLRAYKWHHLMSASGKGALRTSLRSLFGGLALGLITPGRLGELGRCAFVGKPERGRVAVLTLFDRLLDSWALLTAMAASLFFLVSRPAAIFGVAVWLAGLPLVMGFPALISHFATLARRLPHLDFLAVAEKMPPVPTSRLAVLALAAMWAEIASFYFLLRAFTPASISVVLATYPYIVLAGDLPVSFSGVGVREGAAALLLSPYAIPAGSAVGAALAWFLCAILVPAVLGAIWLAADYSGKRLRDCMSS